MNRFYVIHPNVLNQQSCSYPTLAAAIDYAKSKNYPSAIVEYKGETSVEYKTEFSEQPGDPMEVKR